MATLDEKLKQIIQEAVLLPEPLKIKFLATLPYLNESQANQLCSLFSGFKDQNHRLNQKQQKDLQKMLIQKSQIIKTQTKNSKRQLLKCSENASQRKDAAQCTDLLTEFEDLLPKA